MVSLSLFVCLFVIGFSLPYVFSLHNVHNTGVDIVMDLMLLDATPAS